MNLLDKRRGQTFLLLSALFFFSCQEDSSLQGYKAIDHFNVLYREIPIESSVYWSDSIVTSNLNSNVDGTRRLLVGLQSDQEFGEVTASAYTQYLVFYIPDSLNYADYDSVSLDLSFDLSYTYGSPAPTTQEIVIHELDDTLTRYPATNLYYNSSFIKTKSSPLGSKTFAINPPIFEDQHRLNQGYIAEGKPENVKVFDTNILLDYFFGKRIFDTLANQQTRKDTIQGFQNYKRFTTDFKGIAITPVNADKIFAFNPTDPINSKITLHIHNKLNNKRDSITLTFNGLTSFSRIQGDPSGSDLSELTQKYQPIIPTTDKRYLQNGTGITTKLDFKNFIDFSDTIPNMIVNSAELVLEGVETDGLKAPPQSLMLWGLKDNNRFRMLGADEAGKIFDQAQQLLYDRNIMPYDNGIIKAFSVRPDRDFQSPTVTGISLSYIETDKNYSGFISLFLDALYRDKPGRIDFSKIGLYSLNPAAGKTVNRVSFNNVKLKLYYTRSLTNTQ